MSHTRKKIVVIGGGTGSVAVLSGLKQYDHMDLSVIVSMTDDGGSNAVIRDQFGLLPLSDIRKSIIALGEADRELLRQIFTYRFDKGDGLKGHTLGNLIMMGLTDIAGSEMGAFTAVQNLFGVKGQVIPVTLDHAHLVATYDDGTTLKSEHLIDEPDVWDKKIIEFKLEPEANAYVAALAAIHDADYLIIGPGDLYTTTLANIVVNGIADAVKQSKAQIIFISNLMTKKGQTHWMKASDLLNEMTRYMGRKPDTVLLHNDGFPEQVLELYARKHEFPIEDDLNETHGVRVVRKDIVTDDIVIPDKGDTLERSLIRHNPEKIAEALYELCT